MYGEECHSLSLNETNTILSFEFMQFYSDTVKQMALCQLVVGSPLRTIFLLIAGQPADVFSNTTCTSSLPDAVNVSQHSSQVIC